MIKTIAFFDFDGTLTTKDTFIEFIKFQKGQLRFLVGFALLFPILILYKLKIIANWRAKEIVLTHFFRGDNILEFKKKAEEYILIALPKILNPIALEKLSWHKNQGHRVVVVSASMKEWIETWTNEQQIELLSSQLETVDGKITGKIAGKNCFGIEKVNQIKSVIDLEEYPNIFAYGDSNGDKELLAIANNPFYRKFY
ncbi:MAG: HAD-IB family hydrolase [Cytophagales bacterium]|nr:MAG: HAD-IB family hydrolase [Cytophagales bacterium]